MGTLIFLSWSVYVCVGGRGGYIPEGCNIPLNRGGGTQNNLPLHIIVRFT